MGWLVAAGVALVALAGLALLSVRVRLALTQVNLRATLRVEVQFLVMRLRREVVIRDLTAGIQERLSPRAERRPGARSGATPAAAVRYLARSVRCSRLRLRLEVGGVDACDSALLAGLGWSAVYAALAQVARWVRLDAAGLAVAVVPNFHRPLMRTDLDCILSVPLWQAIAAVAMMLRQARREGVALVRPRDGRRKKGEGIGGRAPDSGPDEDGHGKP
ncbi:MAG: DUF2953 domain-containing protein [Symbiobacterium sp.]|uniref:DUF2953 domain-containing protein n=1 Tax=Symbiobacterium sp. TaxID=1971213 RepID=UPI0034649585